MIAHAPVAALRVANEAFLVSSTIERCPKTMMIRELMVNAIEAAALAADHKHVVITSVRIDGVPKLCIRNTGRGMSAVELDRICDLASSLYKENSLDGNFGMGAKVASLPSNKHGLRYRSCKDGTVSEVILCQRDGVYGRLRRGSDASGTLREVFDVTATCQAEGGYDLATDWTEVVLFGNAATQNTVTDPYGGNPRMDADWLLSNLLLRFFRTPTDVVVSLLPDVRHGSAAHRLVTLGALKAPTAETETVTTPSGIMIHYRHDPAADTLPVSDAHRGGMGGLVYKDEIYDPRTGARWVLDAPTYGFPFGAKYCSVFVELPDDYLVRPEAYRQFLRFRGGDQRQVFLHDFGQLVTTYLPAWLKAIIRAYGPQQAKFLGEVEDELRALVAELGIDPEYKPPAQAKPAAVKPPSPPAPPKASEPAAKPEAKEPPKPAMPRSPPPKKFEQPPEIIGLDSDELIEERGLRGRAAKFYQTSHQLFVNLKYPAVLALAAQLEAEFYAGQDAEAMHGAPQDAAGMTGAAQDAEGMRGTARSVAAWAVTRRIARALVYSLSKKAAGWPAEDVQRAQSPESFSLVADDWSTIIEAARQRMQDELGADQPPIAGAPAPETMQLATAA
jgi:hypothetical protein